METLPYQSGDRTFLLDQNQYGYYSRPFLGLKKSAVILSDTGAAIGYAGNYALSNIVDPQTKQSLAGETYTIPTDFRTDGIRIMTALGIPESVQIQMFSNFITNYSVEQRNAFVAQWDAIDQNDETAVQAFVVEMQQMLA